MVAEEVEKVNSDLVVRDDQGKPYTVRYDAVNAMLLNEFLKEHREVQEQKATIAEFKEEIAKLTATVKEQAAQIQKVSAEVEISGFSRQIVLNISKIAHCSSQQYSTMPSTSLKERR